MLTTLGYRVACASNGAKAIKMFQSGEEFELLFSDIVMPNGISGVELAREAKRRNKDIKVLLTSGYARGILEQHCAEASSRSSTSPSACRTWCAVVRSILHDPQN